MQKFCVIFKINVRPHKVVQAAKWPINNSALYKEEGIALCENWQNDQESDFDNSVHDKSCLLYTSPSPRDLSTSRMPSSA